MTFWTSFTTRIKKVFGTTSVPKHGSDFRVSGVAARLMVQHIEDIRRLKETNPLHVADPSDLFDCLYDIILHPSDTIQEDVIFLVDTMVCPVTDPTADRDLLFCIMSGPTFAHQLIVTRMLVAAGAPIHQATRDCANAKFDGLWGLIVNPAYEQAFYDGPIALLGTRTPP